MVTKSYDLPKSNVYIYLPKSNATIYSTVKLVRNLSGITKPNLMSIYTEEFLSFFLYK